MTKRLNLAQRKRIKILEIGSGVGPRIPRGKNVSKMSLECNESSVRDLKKMGLKAMFGTAQEIPLKSNSQDIIEMHGSITAPKMYTKNGNFFYGNKKKALKEAYRVLKRGGRLIISTSYYLADFDNLKKIGEKAKQIGFKVAVSKSGKEIIRREIEFKPEWERKTDVLVLEKI